MGFLDSIKSLGEYPAQYNPRVHGPYFPGRNYGKVDTAFGNVKLGELPAWLSRRSKNPIDWGHAVGRWFWNYQHRWSKCKHSTIAPLSQVAFSLAIFYYIVKFDEHRAGKHSKYH